MDILAAEELDAVPGEGEEQVEAPGSTLVFSCDKEGHFAANCPDKAMPKETPDVNLISSTVAVTRSQGPLLIKEM